MNRRRFLLGSSSAVAASLLARPGLASTVSAANPEPSPARLTAAQLTELTNLFDVEEAAKTRMGPVYDYVASGVADEITVRWNLEKYRELRLRPRALEDVSTLQPGIELFGQKLTMPILLAPTSNHRLVHPEGEIATARGAGLAEVAMVLSSGATTDITDVMKVATQPVWFQLYTQRDRELTKDIVQHAESAGAKALCVTIDSPVTGARNREARSKVKLLPGMSHPNYLGREVPRNVQNLQEVRPTKIDWEEMRWLRSFARTPMLLKGILTPEDAEKAIQMGAAGIMVSNHGGRALDTVPATIECLPGIVERVAGRVPVLVDGGIRRGTDVLKALALGATATMVGRPYLYGLAVGGAEGVAHVMKTLRLEFLMAMALTGRPTIASIDRSVIW